MRLVRIGIIIALAALSAAGQSASKLTEYTGGPGGHNEAELSWTSLVKVMNDQLPATTTPVQIGVVVPPAVAAFKLPTLVGGGVAFNQLSNTRANLWVSAIAPVVSSVGLYESTTADVQPVFKTDPATGRTIVTFTTSVREGVHKTLYTSAKVILLIGGDAGVGVTQGTTGVVLGLSGSITATFVYKVTDHWGVIVPLRGLYNAAIGGWYVVPEVGVVWQP